MAAEETTLSTWLRGVTVRDRKSEADGMMVLLMDGVDTITVGGCSGRGSQTLFDLGYRPRPARLLAHNRAAFLPSEARRPDGKCWRKSEWQLWAVGTSEQTFAVAWLWQVYPCANPFAAGRPLGHLTQSGPQVLPSLPESPHWYGSARQRGSSALLVVCLVGANGLVDHGPIGQRSDSDT